MSKVSKSIISGRVAKKMNRKQLALVIQENVKVVDGALEKISQFSQYHIKRVSKDFNCLKISAQKNPKPSSGF